MKIYKSSQPAILIIAIIKDIRRFLLIFSFPIGLLILLCIGLYLNFGLSKSIEAFNYYFWKILIIVFIINAIFSTVARVILKLISPYYVIEDGYLKIYPRSIKIITDIPYVQIEIEKIKYVWRINNIFDKIFPGSRTIFLGIDINQQGLPYQQSKKISLNLISKLSRRVNESLMYQPIISIYDGDEFLVNLPNAKLQEVAIFENIFFYLSLL